MLKLTITNSVMESSVPSDTFIEDIINSRYVDALESSTSDEEMLKKVLCESLMKTIPVQLDYRNNNIDAAAESLYSVATNDNLSKYLKIFPSEIHMGHFHRHSTLEDNDIELIVNGSFAGTDEFAESIRKSNKPSQTLIIYNKEGQECIYNIKLK